MDQLRGAFQKIKQDIDFLRQEIVELKERMIEICEIIENLDKKTQYFGKNHMLKNSTNQHQFSTDSTHPSTHNYPLKPLNNQNLGISIGNQGASTDKQTNRHINIQAENIVKKDENSIKNVVKILNSLDNLKKEIRLKFKRLTEQEILVFSTLYQLDEELGYSDYKTLSKELKLSESSIRDYIRRIIKKGIPIGKTRINNKNIQLSISKDLKKIASLSTILKLRDL